MPDPMPLDGARVLADAPSRSLQAFLRESAYARHGAVITDLDGTIVHEADGRVRIPAPVEVALAEFYRLGRPLILNTLRFPLSVIRTFGQEWHAIASAPIPAVTLNGSQYGFVTRSAAGDLVFEEIDALPLAPGEIDEVFTGIEGLLRGGVTNLLLFYYPRDWRMGEIIWTPVPEKVAATKAKYQSASAVTAVAFEKLRAQVHAEPVCMMFLLIDVPHDTRMAYQHASQSSFFTHEGVDKRSGAHAIASSLEVDLAHSIGAGDTEMDRFLDAVGLAILVGHRDLPFRGLSHTVRIDDALALGDVLLRLADMGRTGSDASRT